MHGVGGILRQAMIYAKPWQRYLLTGAVVALGIALVMLGQAKGLVLVALGTLMTYGAIRRRNISKRSDQKLPEATHGEE